MHSLSSPAPFDHETRAKRIAESTIRSAILRNAQGCSLNISRLVTELRRPLTRIEVRMCMAQERVSIQEDGKRFPNSPNHRDLHAMLDRPEVRDALDPDVIESHRANHRQELIDMIARVLPHYHDCPPERLPDVLASIDAVRSVLENGAPAKKAMQESLVA